jgi:capsular exopolysaccharide synthesis family protein
VPEYELNLRDYLRIFRKRKLVIIVCFFAAIIISLVYLSRQPVFYKASATVKIEERKTVTGLMTEWVAYTPADVMESQTKIITGFPVMKRVALKLGMINENSSELEINEAVTRVQGSIETERVGFTNIISIIATTDSPEGAMMLANTVAEACVEENLLDKSKQARSARQFIEEQLGSLENRLQQAEDQLKQFSDEVKDIKLAEPIQEKLMDLEFELGALLQQYTEKHPQVIQMRDQIRELEAQIQGFSGRELEYARLNREVEVNTKLYAMLKQKLEEARISEAEKVSDISIVDPAVMPTRAVSHNINLGIIIGGIMGLILGITFAFIRETLDTSIGTIEDVESVVKLPVLGVIPSIEQETGKKMKGRLLSRWRRRFLSEPKKSESEENLARMIAHYQPKSPVTESFRNIRTNLKLSPTKKTVLVTSSSPREGKSTIVTNLGLVMAQTGAKTLLVSSDLRRPAISKSFGLKREPGFSELLTGSVDLEAVLKGTADIMLGEISVEEVVGKSTGIDNIWILPSGALPFNPSEILDSHKLLDVIEELKHRFDVIIFDSPPVLPVTDASLLASKLDCVVIIYEIGRTSRDALLRAKTQLESVGGKISGIILNHTQPQTEAIASYPYYRYKYRYYGKEESEEKRKKVKGQEGA